MAKKKGFGSFVASIFVEQVEDEYDDEELENLPSTPEKTIPSPTVKESSGENVKEPTINKDIVEAIKQVMDDNNLDGYDYYEFMQAVAEQKDMPSEKRKYEVVFSVIKGMGITKDHLVSTADHYLEVIKNHRKDFDSKIASEEQEKVVKLKNDAEAIESTITEKTEQIEALKKEIDALHNKKVKVLDVAQENETQVTQLRQEGNLAYKLFMDQIADGKNKINQYIS